MAPSEEGPADILEDYVHLLVLWCGMVSVLCHKGTNEIYEERTWVTCSAPCHSVSGYCAL